MSRQRTRIPKRIRVTIAAVTNATTPPRDYEFDGTLTTECWNCGQTRPDDLNRCSHCGAECTPF